MQVKISTKILRKQQEKHIKDAIDVYIKRIVKDLGDKTFKYYIYIEYFNVVLDLIRRIESKKTSNIIFNKEPRLLKDYIT